MTAADLIPRIFLNFKGKTPTKAPANTEPEYQVYLGYIDQLLQKWAKDSRHVWQTLTEEVSATIVNGFADCPEGFLRVSEKPLVNGKPITYTTFKNRRNVEDGVYVSLRSNKFVFTKPERHATGTITVGVVFSPPRVSDSSSVITCDDELWIELAVAAEIARNDSSKDDQYADLYAKALEQYKSMARNARYIPAGQVNAIPAAQSTLGRTW